MKLKLLFFRINSIVVLRMLLILCSKLVLFELLILCLYLFSVGNMFCVFCLFCVLLLCL